ncbi:hypothetical protein ABTZ99_07770 [Actinosynnema sp. NPDC002837]
MDIGNDHLWGGSARDLLPDGQVYVDLHGFDPRGPAVAPDAAVRMVLDALHVPTRPIPPDADGRGAYLRSVVDGRDLLLILDNVRDSAAALWWFAEEYDNVPAAITTATDGICARTRGNWRGPCPTSPTRAPAGRTGSAPTWRRSTR